MTAELSRDHYGSDVSVWAIWARFPGSIGWTSKRISHSSRERVEARAEVWRGLYKAWGLPGIVEVRSEHDGEPPDPER
ncbi:MAG: hypothetical protein EKK42_35710 [Pseudonocardiaceae bacterium]|nr:MAG: hypothetical protein EKK42_35710 [Pseudonocardiaceae bacterium]